MALAADIIGGPPAAVIAANFEANVLYGPHPQRERRHSAGGRHHCRLSCRLRRP